MGYQVLDLPERYAGATLAGIKSFDVRGAGHGLEVDDLILYRVVDEDGRRVDNALSDIPYRITYMVGVGDVEDHCAFAIEPADDAADDTDRALLRTLMALSDADAAATFTPDRVDMTFIASPDVAEPSPDDTAITRRVLSTRELVMQSRPESADGEAD